MIFSLFSLLHNWIRCEGKTKTNKKPPDLEDLAEPIFGNNQLNVYVLLGLNAT